MTDSSLSLRLIETADVAEAATLARTAFNAQRPYEQDLKRHLATDPGSWWWGHVGDRAVGMAGLSVYGSCAYLGMMVVHPEWQGRGIGGRILRHILAAADGRRIPMLLLDATVAGYPLYLAHGFLEEDGADLFARGEAPVHAAARHREKVRLATAADHAALSALDARITGADRGRVLKSLLAEFPGRAFVSMEGQGISGYVFAQSQRIGPWLATGSEAAEALLEAALYLSFASPPEIAAPLSNTAARPMLERHGFLYKRTLRHMRRGGARLLSTRASIYGYGSFALG